MGALLLVLFFASFQDVDGNVSAGEGLELGVGRADLVGVAVAKTDGTLSPYEELELVLDRDTRVDEGSIGLIVGVFEMARADGMNFPGKKPAIHPSLEAGLVGNCIF